MPMSTLKDGTTIADQNKTLHDKPSKTTKVSLLLLQLQHCLVLYSRTAICSTSTKCSSQIRKTATASSSARITSQPPYNR
jgi:hypothetical protein